MLDAGGFRRVFLVVVVFVELFGGIKLVSKVGVRALDAVRAGVCASKLAVYPFDGFLICGLGQWGANFEEMARVVEAVQSEIGDRVLHVSDFGTPDVKELFRLGVDSVDSSSYASLAAEARTWSDPRSRVDVSSPEDLVRLAIMSLAVATGASLPLSFYSVADVEFDEWLIWR